MSQPRRQGSDNTSVNQLPAPLPIPPASKHQVLVHPPLSSDLIPRDYLGPRSDGQALRSGSAIASPRKPLPSPLHTNLHLPSPRQVSASPSQISLSPRSLGSTSPCQNNSTISHPAHATVPTPSSDTHSRASSGSEAVARDPWESLKQYDMNPKMRDNRVQQVPDPADSHESRMSSPISPANSFQSTPQNRPGQRMMPRTSSIDSAISSLSSASQTHKSSFDANALSQADIGNLITTAGSAEAVIIHLLKEKHHAASQNSQLWRLVDKQRTLILGLNKDLERALKEKERYRKKVKELQSSPPPLPSADESKLRLRDTESSGTLASYGPGRKSQPNNRGVLSNSTDSASQGRDFTQLHSTTAERQHSSHSASLHGLGVGDLPVGLDREHPTTPPTVSHDQQAEARNNQSLVYSRQELSTASPISSTGSRSPVDSSIPSQDKQQEVLPPGRKPPPAPLNLSQKDFATPEPDVFDSDSEYEDILAADELPVERGRRRTRDDDDREREAALTREKDVLQTSGSQGSNTHAMAAMESPSDPQQTLPSFEYSESPISSPRRRHAGPFGGLPAISIPKSPGLPVSPRPEDRPLGSPLPRLPRETPGSLPMSSENNLSGLTLSPRLGHYQTPFSMGTASSSAANGATFASVPVDTHNRPIPSIDAAVKIDTPHEPVVKNNGIFQGLVSDEFPNLLLPPNALPSINVKVSSSRLRPSRNSYMASRPSEEEPVFTLGVFSRSDNAELWRTEKVIAALPQLDQQIRLLSSFGGRLPDRSIFSGHSPAKVDTRRAALNAYFETLLDTPMDDKAALIICQFLSSDAIEPRDDEMSLLKGNHQAGAEILRGPDGRPRKEGYLTKRGKNFGGWKARYFVLHGPELKYFESPGGPHLGTIKLYNAQIGKQSQSAGGRNSSPSRSEEDSDNQYRHAFLILEPKRKDSSALVRHVLCAESDEERDAWVDALLEYVDGQSENDGHNGTSKFPSSTVGKQHANAVAKSKIFPNNGGKKADKGTGILDMEGPDTVQGFSYDDAVPAEPPVLGPSSDQHIPKSPIVSTGHLVDSADSGQDSGQFSSRFISGPTNGTVIHDAGAWGNKAATSVKEKKRSIWGFRTRSSFDLASQLQASHDFSTSHVNNNAEKREFVRPVFGLPLAEAVQFCAPQGVDVDLPAVVYRCIEYLKAKGAESEEGIFRLSGSNLVVKALKERFNTEGDVDFLADDQYHDVHAVASLFKQYLRELPTTVLTRELHLDFLRVLELHEKQKKVAAFNFLVHRLPKPNMALLRALVQFLIVIVNNSDVNKMTIRNVGIVFAPTLNIPAPVFSMFLTDFVDIFDGPPNHNTEQLELNVQNPISSEDFRYPYRQIPSGLSSPGYSQATFSEHAGFVEDASLQNGISSVSKQPSYERFAGSGSEEYSLGHASSPSSSRMLTPNIDNSRSAKAKRRESSLLFMEVNHQDLPTSIHGENA
ncbi:GTPase-activating protein BEM3 [Aspergillus ibericus CBS 121593]|uniref:RhoGAP-domain-containing protein n=1 Tax=Aspergillus ibericus CBS 121593 TaxID=1448316 RepID=A0A395GSD9_9EURO|nr:RhoGAP-domain-containing protein [Aspergillus ibericus CBS 121593]RAK98326.1 RhoGAP-domain-containing protein [Aspergillus ibericus CBS 121593]